MDESINHSSRKQNASKKHLLGGSSKDLWLIAQEGSVLEVESALALLKKNCGNINGRNSFGLTPLHIATWRNNIPIVRRLLEAGADPNARDGESGWSSLHRALHFGHLAVGSVLLQSGASITSEDSKFRTPIDLLSGPVLQSVSDGDRSSVTTEVFSWGSGVNYQLGTGNAHIQKLPCKVDALHGSFIKFVSASKFHSVAVTSNGEVYTWGFGRGGRLGHPDFDIHSGQAAVITPRQVTAGLGVRRVKAVAAAKHHTVVATEGGEVFTWGSNREGQLGYTSVDTQPTPRRVSYLKARIVAVAAANKHTAAVSDSGEIFTWGCNREGQLGYGTSNSASNYTPRLVECLTGKVFIAVSAAKYHTIVLGTDGEVFAWGHRLVTPRRVVIARNIRKSGTTPLKFHRKERLHVVAIAAGVTHSLALTDDGALFFWVSSDPNSQCQQLYSLCGKNVVSISAGKYWTAAVTVFGDVYMWDGKKRNHEIPITTRLHGVKKATSVSVGETHLLIISSLYHPVYPSFIVNDKQKIKQKATKQLDELDEGFVFDDSCFDEDLYPVQTEITEKYTAPSLKLLCEKVAMEYLVEPRNAMQLLEIADSLGADDLKKHCEVIVIRNLDYILTVSTHDFSSAPLDILVKLEKSLDTLSSESWSNRRLPTPTATLPAIVYSEEDVSDNELFRTRGRCTKRSSSNKEGGLGLDIFLTANIIGKEEDIAKQVRALKKKLQQIEFLEDKMLKGHALDDQQIKKVQTRPELERDLVELGVPVEKVETKPYSSASVDGKGNKRAVLRKQRRKSKNKGAEMEEEPNIFEVINQKDSVKCSEDQCPSFQDKGKISEEAVMKPMSEDSATSIKKDLLDAHQCKSLLSPSVAKKKNKKGGLSMFLSGALDDTPKYVAPPPPVLKSEGPVWGGAKTPKGSTSLREIQTEQFTRNEIKPNTVRVPVEEVSDGCNGKKLSLSSFLPSSPIPVVSAPSPQAQDTEKNTPSWAASGTPPSLSRLSLRDIQLQQEKKQQALSHSPMTRTTGFSVAAGQVSPSDSSSGLNRWFKPEIETPSSLRSIQIEEKAIKDLKRFYSSVKVVKNPL